MTITSDVDGRKCVITLDTRAARTIVRPDIVSGPIESANGLKLHTATGESAAIKGKKVKIRIGKTHYYHEVLVADIVDEVILGMDFMRANDFMVDVGRGVLYHDNIELPLQPNGTETSTKRVILEHRERLPSNSETIVWGTLEGGSGSPRLWVVEAIEYEKGVKEVIIAKTLVKPDNDNKIPIRILNLSDRTKIIKKRQ